MQIKGSVKQESERSRETHARRASAAAIWLVKRESTILRPERVLVATARLPSRRVSAPPGSVNPLMRTSLAPSGPPRHETGMPNGASLLRRSRRLPVARHRVSSPGRVHRAIVQGSERGGDARCIA